MSTEKRGLDALAVIADFDISFEYDPETAVEPWRLEFYSRDTGTSEVIHAGSVESAANIALAYIEDDIEEMDTEAAEAIAEDREHLLNEIESDYGLPRSEAARLTSEPYTEAPEPEPSPRIVEADEAWQRGYEAGFADAQLPSIAAAAQPFDDRPLYGTEKDREGESEATVFALVFPVRIALG